MGVCGRRQLGGTRASGHVDDGCELRHVATAAAALSAQLDLSSRLGSSWTLPPRDICCRYVRLSGCLLQLYDVLLSIRLHISSRNQRGVVTSQQNFLVRLLMSHISLKFQ